MNAFEECVDVDWSQMRCGREDLNVRIFRDVRRLVSPGDKDDAGEGCTREALLW